MPRRGGHNPSGNRRKHLGHRMHKRTRAARRLARVGRGRSTTRAWGRAGL